ncbi:MAG: DUF2062 domain-containing protein [Bacillota bacterium]|nr:DUF2062 domain-containing protein [Bacillota bacterium]MDW7682700.1 DUF2062 domain-containing protein [Bacillota bacterium]
MADKQFSRWEKVKKRFFETIEKQIVNDKPRSIALGCSLGIGINFFPTLGLGFLFAFLLAALFRVNRAGATVTSLITGPLIPIMYALNLVVGGLILTPVTGKENLLEFVIHQYAVILKLGNIQDKIFGFLEFFGSTFVLGAVVNATIMGTAFYFLVSFILNKKIA